MGGSGHKGTLPGEADATWLLPDPPDCVRFTPCELPPTPNCIAQILIVGGLLGHFRLGWESLKEWRGGGEAGGAWLPLRSWRRAEWRAPRRGHLCAPVCMCRRVWGARPRGSVSACAFGCRRTPVFSSIRKRGECRACGSESAFLRLGAGRGRARGRALLRAGCSSAAPSQPAGTGARIRAVVSSSFLLPSCWPVKYTLTVLIVLNKGCVGVPLHFTTLNVFK